MNSDEIVDQVRSIREAYAARFNYDLVEIGKDLKAKEQSSGRKMADLKPVEPQLKPAA